MTPNCSSKCLRRCNPELAFLKNSCPAATATVWPTIRASSRSCGAANGVVQRGRTRSRARRRIREKRFHPPSGAANASRCPQLPRIEIIHELPEHELTCVFGCRKHAIGEEVREQLEIVPMQIRVIKHVRNLYRCRDCEIAPVTADKPAQLI